MTIDYTPDVNPVLYGIGGRPYGAKRLSMLKNYLAKRRVELLVGPEAVNELRGYVAGFQAFPDGTARMLFARNHGRKPCGMSYVIFYFGIKSDQRLI